MGDLRLTGQLRWVRWHPGRLKLQQEWRDIETGESEWETVPVDWKIKTEYQDFKPPEVFEKEKADAKAFRKLKAANKAAKSVSKTTT